MSQRRPTKGKGKARPRSQPAVDEWASVGAWFGATAASVSSGGSGGGQNRSPPPTSGGIAGPAVDARSSSLWCDAHAPKTEVSPHTSPPQDACGSLCKRARDPCCHSRCQPGRSGSTRSRLFPDRWVPPLFKGGRTESTCRTGLVYWHHVSLQADPRVLGCSAEDTSLHPPSPAALDLSALSVLPPPLYRSLCDQGHSWLHRADLHILFQAWHALVIPLSARTLQSTVSTWDQLSLRYLFTLRPLALQGGPRGAQEEDRGAAGLAHRDHGLARDCRNGRPHPAVNPAHDRACRCVHLLSPCTLSCPPPTPPRPGLLSGLRRRAASGIHRCGQCHSAVHTANARAAPTLRLTGCCLLGL